MKPWTKRVSEEANLLNPSFCCVALTSSTVGYMSISDSGIPYPLAFMVLPIVLHKATRESLPRDVRTSFAAWIQENASARILFPERVTTLKQYSREAILFGLTQNWLTLQPGGMLQTRLSETDVNRFLRKLNGEARDCVSRARFVGKWLASAGSAQTVMALWGIRL